MLHLPDVKLPHCYMLSGLYLKISDDRWIVINGFAVHSFPHALAIKSELLHSLLLGKVRPLVEQLTRCLVLEPRHMEEPGRWTNICCHSDGFVTPEDVRRNKFTMSLGFIILTHIKWTQNNQLQMPRKRDRRQRNTKDINKLV